MMRPNAAIATLVAALVVSGAYAQVNRFDYDDDQVRGLRYAAWEAGTIFGSAASPYTLAQMRLAYERASAGYNQTASSPEAVAALAAMRARLDVRASSDTMGLGAAISAVAALEAYPRLYSTGDPASPWSWSDRASLVSIPFELFALDSVYAKATLDLKEDHNAIEATVDPANWSNWPESMDYIDYTFPFESFVSAEYGPLAASIGRDTLRWGAGATGTLVLSDVPDYYDYLDASVSGDWFSYRFAWISLDPSITSEEIASSDLIEEPYVSAKNLYLHRFEFLILDRIAIALVEGLMVGGVAPDLAYANPFLILHNRFAWNAVNFMSAASVLGAELRVNPWRYMELYGSFAMNQYQSDYERERYAGAAAAIPNAYAYMAGGEAAYPFLGGWARATIEYVYTNPWMYIRENRLNSFTWRRRLASNIAGADQLADAPIGYRYGPDARVFYSAIGWDAPGNLSFMASFEYAERGEQTIDTAYDEGDDAVALTTPSGIAELTTALGLEASWSPRPGLSLYGALCWMNSDNAGHVVGATASSVDAKVGFSISFPQILDDNR